MPVRMKSIKRKHTDITESPSNKRLALSANETYCSECDILFSKSENFLQHKLYYCGTKSSSSSLRSLPESNAFRAPVPFDRPIQIGQFIYVPVPIVPSSVDPSPSPPICEVEKHNKPLDLSKPKKTLDDAEQRRVNPTSPLDLTIDKPSNSKVPVQIHECDYCSIRFSSVKTLHAHQESYCLEYRKQKKNSSTNNESKNTLTDSTRSVSIEVELSKRFFCFLVDLNLLLPQRTANLFVYLLWTVFFLIVCPRSCVVSANIVATLFAGCECISNFISRTTNRVPTMISSSLRR